jgi:uncharacterized membrane protein
MIRVEKVETANVTTWVRNGFRYFFSDVLIWVVFAGMLIGIAWAASIHKLLQLAFVLVSPVFLAGLMYPAREVSEGRRIGVTHFFIAFGSGRILTALLALGGIQIAAAVASAMVLFFSGGSELIAALQSGDESAQIAWTFSLTVGLLIILAIQVGVFMGAIYATPLILFRGSPVGEAMYASLNASIVNFLPLTLLSIVYLGLMILASLATILGWLVLLPVSAIMLYASYRDIFGA